MPLRARMCSAEGSLALLVSAGYRQTELYFLVVYFRKGGLVTENAYSLGGVRPARLCRKYTPLCFVAL